MGAIKTGWDFFQDQILDFPVNFYIFLFMM